MQSSWVSTQLRLLATALVFYTRIPLALWFDYSPAYLDQASRYLPAIGLLVGAVAAIVLLAADSILSPSIAIALSMAATVALTGAFHEDGFADMCDGFGGGWTPERIMEIMKDSRLGTFGVVGIVLILLIKFLALTEVRTAEIAAVLIIGHSISRLAAISYIPNYKYVQSDGQSKVKPLAEGLSMTGLLIAVITVLIPLIVSWSVGLWLALIPIVVVRWYLGWLFIRKLGGYTGDCLGAAQQVTEVSYYLGVVAFT